MTNMIDPVKKVEQMIAAASLEHGNDTFMWSYEEGRVTRKFFGFYSIAEIEAVLSDMRSAQSALNAINGAAQS